MTRRHLFAFTAAVLGAALWSVGCGLFGPSGPNGCGGSLAFSVLPVPFSAISAATVIGNLGPPGHTIPTDHAGFYLNGTAIPLVAPASMRITYVKTAHYLTSPFRAGLSDYAIGADLCDDYTIGLGHIQTVVSKIGSQTGSNCQTYSTAEETVQSCINDNADIQMAAGESIGTVGGSTAGAFDFGLYKTGHQNFFVNPSRYSSLTISAVCPYDPFTSDLRAQINPKIGDFGRPSSGEDPLCGTMSVDVAGTARGVWVLQSAPVNQVGDETNFIVLAPHPLYQQSGQTFSLGPSALSDGLVPQKFPVLTSGRVNRQFKDITAGSGVYCYVSDASALRSYFVRLDAPATLFVQKVSHAGGAGPCVADPATWVIDGSALSFIR